MRIQFKLTALAVGFTMFASGASAECFLPSWVQDGFLRPSMNVDSQCRHTDAGTWKDPYSTGAATAFGKQLTAQRINLESCGVQQQMLVVDGASGKTIRFFGQSCGHQQLSVPSSFVDCFSGTDGLLQLSQTSTIPQVVQSAVGNDIGIAEDGIDDFLGEMPRHRRIDPFCGCKTFYPDSAGAKL